MQTQKQTVPIAGKKVPKGYAVGWLLGFFFSFPLGLIIAYVMDTFIDKDKYRARAVTGWVHGFLWFILVVIVITAIITIIGTT